MDAIAEFRAAMGRAGLLYPGEIVMDGKLHRFRSGDDSEANSWYVLHPADPIVAGAFGCWKRQINEKWKDSNGNIPPKDYTALKRKWAESAAAAAREEAERKERIATVALEEFNRLPKAENHDYLLIKGVKAAGDVRINPSGDLVIPLRDINGKLWSYQTIDVFGDKLFRPGGRVAGCFFTMGDISDGVIVVCEGYATGATIHEATGFPVCCAMNCGNLRDTVADLRKRYEDRTIIIAADNDRFTTDRDGNLTNPGVTKAEEAAKLHRAKTVIPSFPGKEGTDFNDLHQQAGIGVVRSAFETALGVGLGQRMTIKSLLAFLPEEDSSSVLGKRYLCRGGSCVLVGQTSAGKSSLGMQMAIMFAFGLDFFGLKPARPLRSLYLQAENDMGDTAEMLQGILVGTGLVNDDPATPERAREILDKNLIIVRDQTHIGPSFPAYARRLVELHRPDIFWCDPLLSFFGDDINDQQAMSLFLRSELNPISEATGIIWMMLHHTGKPNRDANAHKGWNSRDYAYMGLGSSELSNWARAIITVVNTNEDEFKMIFAKRGWRSGVVDDRGSPTTELNLAHGDDRICWKRIPKPKSDDESSDMFSRYANTITTPTKATAIVSGAAVELQRGVRTVWKLWDSGNGPLGSLFTHVENGLWVVRKAATPNPYRDD